MKAWIQQSETQFDYVDIVEEPRLDGVAKTVRLALGEVKDNGVLWDISIFGHGHITSYAKLVNAMKAVEYLTQLNDTNNVPPIHTK